jgi:copper chaperone CopZ
MTKVKLKIENMHCTSCAMNIDMDLEDLDGVKFSSTSYAKQVCEVEFDEGKLSMAKILDQVKDTGYTARVLE